MCRAQLDGCTRIATEVHHVVEVAAGGSDDPDNLVSVCGPCHTKQGGSATNQPRSSSNAPASTPRRRRRRYDESTAPRTIIPRTGYDID
jgi:hypothetical protein